MILCLSLDLVFKILEMPSPIESLAVHLSDKKSLKMEHFIEEEFLQAFCMIFQNNKSHHLLCG